MIFSTFSNVTFCRQDVKNIRFFLIRIYPMQQPLLGMELHEKKSTKRLQHTENLFRKNLQLKDVC